jgi:ribokinase
MPQKGETITGSDFFSAHGGKGANQAVAAARLGGEVLMCGCVGDDSFGAQAILSLQEAGVNTKYVRQCN